MTILSGMDFTIIHARVLVFAYMRDAIRRPPPPQHLRRTATDIAADHRLLAFCRRQEKGHGTISPRLTEKFACRKALCHAFAGCHLYLLRRAGDIAAKSHGAASSPASTILTVGILRSAYFPHDIRLIILLRYRHGECQVVASVFIVLSAG